MPPLLCPDLASGFHGDSFQGRGWSLVGQGGRSAEERGAWRGSRICLGPCQGSVDTHRGRQGHFLLASHRPISERKGGAREPGRWTSRSPTHLLQALQSCRNTPAIGVHTRMRTHTIQLARVQTALTYAHTPAFICHHMCSH